MTGVKVVFVHDESGTKGTVVGCQSVPRAGELVEVQGQGKFFVLFVEHVFTTSSRANPSGHEVKVHVKRADP